MIKHVFNRLRVLRRQSEKYLEVSFPKTASRLHNLSTSALLHKLRRDIAERHIVWSDLEKLFIHVPKCAGTSINKVLADHGFEIVMTLTELRKLVLEGEEKGPRLLTLDHLNTDILVSLGLLNRTQLENVEAFSVVRNPYSRLLSAYDFHKREGFVSEKTTLSRYLRLVEGGPWSTDRRNVFGMSHALPASYFLTPELWRGPQNIMQLEDPSGLNRFLGKIVGKEVSLERLNSGRRERRKSLSGAEVATINHIYGEDFLIGGYQKHSGPLDAPH